MKFQGLTIAALVLSALLGLLYWSNRHKPAEPSMAKVAPAETAPNILTINGSDINKIELKKKGGDQILLAKDSSGKWQITTPKPVNADQDSVSGLVSSLSSLTAERLVDEQGQNLAPFGLAEPSLVVQITEKDNTVHKVLIGDDTPTGKAAYAKLDGDPRVFTIAGFTKTGIDKNLNDLRDKRLINADSDKISRVELIVKQQNIEFGRDKDEWQILKPKTLRADGTKIDDLIRKLIDARMEVGPDVDSSKVASGFAAGSDVATAKITTDAGSQQLEVRKNKDDYYARSSLIDGVYKVSSDLGQALDKKLDDFRNKKLFDFGLTDPAKIEIHDGSTAYVLTKGGEDWWSADGKKFEKSGAVALVDNLRDLQATEYADSGFTSTVMEILVTSGDGKRTEKVLLSKGAKNPLARRDGDASIYILDSKAIETLQKLATQLKAG